MAHAEAPVVRAGRRSDPRARRADLHGVGCRIHLRAARARARRGRQLSGRDQGRPPSGSRSSERALATGIFNSGTNIGALVTPLVVPWITLYWGWYWAFIITGALGFLWLVVWMPIYRAPEDHPRSAPPNLRTSAAIRRTRRPHIPWLRAAEVSADLGVRARQVPHRPGLVAVPLLDPGFPQSQLTGSISARSARRSSRSISSPTSAASAAGGCRRHCSSAAGA